MQSNSSALLPVAAVLFVIYLVLRWLRSPTYQLKHIPSIGSFGVVSSYFGALKFVRHGHEMIQEGYNKYYGTAFKVPTISRYLVIVSGPDMVDDIRRATDDQLSFREAISELFQSDYMIGRQIRRDPYHVRAVRTPLTRNLSVRFSDIKDEIANSFGDLIPAKGNEWTTVPVHRTVMKIVCRTSNRLFVGLPLCRNPDYRALNEQFTIDVVNGGQLINMFPVPLKPLVGQLLTKIPTNIKRAISHAGPLIQAQLDQEKLLGADRADRPNNLISWLLEEAQGQQRTIQDLVIRLLTVNLAAIHTTSMALTHILYDLATYPEYVTPMREEVGAVVEAEGWTKTSMGKMRKVDSFIKESQRLAIGAVLMGRKVMKDFTFSNGVMVPAGTHVAVAAYSTHRDENNYDNPHEFHGFRFAEMREEEGESIKHQMVSLSPDYMTFGTGRHACPGRFFAVNELKAMLAHILLNYDVKLPNGGSRPDNVWFQGNCAPNRTAQLMFRRRMTHS